MDLQNQLKILFVDNDPLVSEAFSAILLYRIGVKPKLAKNGQEALEMIEKEAPDILITDTNMPLKNGYELIQDVREKFPQIMIFSLFNGLDGSSVTASEIKALGVSLVLDKMNIQTQLMPILERLAKCGKP